MKNLPFFEIATKDGKHIGYDKDSFFCRLSIPSLKAEEAENWLYAKEATVLAREFKKFYRSIIFSTNNKRIISTISSKYEARVVSKHILLDKVRKFQVILKNEEFSSNCQQDYSYIEEGSIDSPRHRETFNYASYYSNCIGKSIDRGWFYA